jgi:hypothetical protein
MRQVIAVAALLTFYSAGVTFAGPDQVKPDQVKPSVAPIIKPDQALAKPDQVKHHLVKPDQVKVALVKPDQVNVSACAPAATTVKTALVQHHWYWHHIFVWPTHYTKG